MSDRNRILICSEDPVFSGALRAALTDHLVAISTGLPDGVEDVDVLVWHSRDTLAISSLSGLFESVPTVVIGGDQPGDLISAVEAGARGYVTDGESTDHLRHAIDTVAQGGAVVPPLLLGILLRHVIDRSRASKDSERILQSLTPREREVFDLAARGSRRLDIAEALFISSDTARTHLQNVYRKLDVHTHAELVVLAADLVE